MDLETARGVTLQALFYADLEHLSAEEIATEREYCMRQVAFARVEKLGDNMIPPEIWRQIYSERVWWLDTEIERRREIKDLYHGVNLGFSPEYVAGVKAKIDLADFIAERYPETRLKRYSGGGFIGRCPFHDDKTPSLGVWPDPDFHWYCFAENDGGDVYSFIQKRDAHGFREAVLVAAAYAGVAPPQVHGIGGWS